MAQTAFSADPAALSFDQLFGALSLHPSWPGPRKTPVFALNEDDALSAIQSAFGPETQVLALARSTWLLESIERVALEAPNHPGKPAFFVSAPGAPEELFFCEDAQDAMDLFRAKTGLEPLGAADARVIAEELEGLRCIIEGQDPWFIVSEALAQSLGLDQPAQAS